MSSGAAANSRAVHSGAVGAMTAAGPGRDLAGVWRTDGYGRWVTVDGRTLRTWDVSAAG